MRTILALILLASSAVPTVPIQAAAQTGSLPKKLEAGRYTCTVRGILCEACKRAILRELGKLKDISAASFDEDSPTLFVTIAHGKTLRLVHIERALHNAAMRIDLGTEFVLDDVRRSAAPLRPFFKAAP